MVLEPGHLLLIILPLALASQKGPQCPESPQLWTPHPYVEGVVGGLSPTVLECRVCRPPNVAPQTFRVIWRRGDGRPLPPSSSSPSFHAYSPHPDTHLLKLRRTPLPSSLLGNYTCALANEGTSAESVVVEVGDFHPDILFWSEIKIKAKNLVEFLLFPRLV